MEGGAPPLTRLMSPGKSPKGDDDRKKSPAIRRTPRKAAQAVGKASRKNGQVSAIDGFNEATSSSTAGDALLTHRQPRPKDRAAQAVIKTAMQADSVCTLLEEADLDTILESMEYFSFKAGETIVKQGDLGKHFFVAHEGTLEVSMNGKVMNTIGPGSAFGGIALLYNCPRTATVTATTAAGVWGADGDTFKKLLRERAIQHAAENHKFLDTIKLFDGFTPRQKQLLGQLALFVQAPEPGTRVITEGEAPAAMYFVKKGELSVYEGGTIDASGNLTGATKMAQLKAGHSFGERAILYNEKGRSSTVVADSKCELLCVGVQQLKELLGDDVATLLERSFILFGLKQSPVLSQFSVSQQHHIAQAMDVKAFQGHQRIDDKLRFAFILDGEVSGQGKQGAITLKRGQFHDDDSLIVTREDDSSRAHNDHSNRVSDLVAGSGGARLAILTKESLAKALKQLGMSAMGSTEETLEHARKLLLAKKVPIFHHLSGAQIEQLSSKFVLQRFTKGAYVMEQGDVGTMFFVIASGQVEVQIDGKVVRTLGKNAHFGERALLFDEARTATVRVTSSEAELWALAKSTFTEIVTGNILQGLVHRLRLQNTSVRLRDLVHEHLIGAGSFGSVRLVSHIYTGLRYALKRVRKKKNGEIPPEVVLECSLLGEIDHPFILQMVKTLETPKSVYILTELITGGELFAAIRTIPRVLTKEESQFYTGSLLLVLEVLHDLRIVYRDLKPENVMLDSQGYLKLIDFGIAKKLDIQTGRTFTTIGTVHYMAPEVMRGKGYGTECDIWSLGVMQFEFVCGCLPFGNDVDDATAVCRQVLKEKLHIPRSYRDDLGCNLLDSLLHKSPGKRLGTGINGEKDIKAHKYFDMSDGNLFDKIIGRVLPPPVIPQKEEYADPGDLDGVTLSDADCLHRED